VGFVQPCGAGSLLAASSPIATKVAVSVLKLDRVTLIDQRAAGNNPESGRMC
jgi:hypothetical protein